jgi:hypothetical protein
VAQFYLYLRKACACGYLIQAITLAFNHRRKNPYLTSVVFSGVSAGGVAGAGAGEAAGAVVVVDAVAGAGAEAGAWIAAGAGAAVEPALWPQTHSSWVIMGRRSRPAFSRSMLMRSMAVTYSG